MSQRAQIFISYRRDDAAGYARAIYDALAQVFGAERVFIDVDDIAAGQAFVEVISRAVGESKVLLVLIGTRWLGERPGQAPRITEVDDFVRLEVGAALAEGMRVVPLLIDGAVLPTAAQLPQDLRGLLQRNALEVGNTRFAADMDRLVVALREVVDAPAPAPAPARSRRIWLGAGVAVLLLAAAALGWRVLRNDRPAIDGSWQASVDYDWPNAHYVERFEFTGKGAELNGSASFLRVPRGVLEGSVGPDGLRFITRSAETGGGGSETTTVHRYRGRVSGGEIRFTMQTEGGSSAHVPVEFVARRVNAAASQARR